jgi:hypothetical protein
MTRINKNNRCYDVLNELLVYGSKQYKNLDRWEKQTLKSQNMTTFQQLPPAFKQDLEAILIFIS